MGFVSYKDKGQSKEGSIRQPIQACHGHCEPGVNWRVDRCALSKSTQSFESRKSSQLPASTIAPTRPNGPGLWTKLSSYTGGIHARRHQGKLYWYLNCPKNQRKNWKIENKQIKVKSTWNLFFIINSLLIETFLFPSGWYSSPPYIRHRRTAFDPFWSGKLVCGRYL